MEHALYEARGRGDWPGYFDVLARAKLFFEIRPDKADAQDSVYPAFRHDPWGRNRWLHLYTEGMLPPPVPGQFFDWEPLRWFAQPSWLVPRVATSFVVNPGSPCEAVLPTVPPHHALWAGAGERAGMPRFAGQLRALNVGGALRGPVAHGLACGALLCVSNGSLWNAMAWHGTGYPGERQRLKEWWGITTREQWLGALGQLLDCEAHSAVWEFALGLRRTIARDFGGHVDPAYWRQSVEIVMRRNAGEAAELTAEGVTRIEPRPESETAARIEGVQRLIGRITRYEARMRADGILDANRYVTSVEAWDLGRASKMARWGLGARFGTLEEAERAVVQAGRSAALTYRSWQDFSAGYILGRCLHFDEEEFGSWYEEMAEAHRILMTEEASPWRNIPFR
ncbi:hypothetical protein SLNWT_3512 [Streptomyces albus]|uniref:DUF1266 domain-containing protein n=1 Tax=Streptomyces albus (strain ATCC 21838 / DSM 41398 / FERM P-419 / JCM 4703 / NBRC 107858) TaxID=1081613 RepID=A0A0B5EMY2_STRA4|nr:hypothetical protein SLNWT_3512 [Streptomyces albus]AOU78192.1 hypothetical protein SLNHY_3501 [Streptomyces albus]AYN33947.1 hypothetical protein DUI70_3445 [Streptomyces albus]